MTFRRLDAEASRDGGKGVDGEIRQQQRRELVRVVHHVRQDEPGRVEHRHVEPDRLANDRTTREEPPQAGRDLAERRCRGKLVGVDSGQRGDV